MRTDPIKEVLKNKKKRPENFKILDSILFGNSPSNHVTQNPPLKKAV